MGTYKDNHPDYQHGPVREYSAEEILQYEKTPEAQRTAQLASQAAKDYDGSGSRYLVTVFDADEEESYTTTVTASSRRHAIDLVNESLPLGRSVRDCQRTGSI